MAESLVQVDREELKREIKIELQRDERKKKTRRLFLIINIVVGVFAAIIIFVAALVAKSGWWQVPLLSRWLYRPVAASRTVEPLSGTNTTTLLAAMAMRAAFNPNIGTLQLTLSEQELTTIINSMLRQRNNWLSFAVDSAQVVLDPGMVELRALTERSGGVKVPLLARVQLTVQDGRLQTDSERLVIGGLTIPHFLANPVIGSASGGLMSGLNRALLGSGNLKNIKITSGRIDITLRR